MTNKQKLSSNFILKQETQQSYCTLFFEDWIAFSKHKALYGLLMLALKCNPFKIHGRVVIIVPIYSKSNKQSKQCELH